MRPVTALLILALPVLLLPANASATDDTGEAVDRAEVKEVFQKYVDDWNSGNLNGVFALLADDVVQMPPDDPAFLGKAALMADWKQFFDEYTDRWDPTITDIVVSGDRAYLRGSFVEEWTPKAGGPSESQKGDSVWVLRRESGEWKLALELWFASGLE